MILDVGDTTTIMVVGLPLMVVGTVCVSVRLPVNIVVVLRLGLLDVDATAEVGIITTTIVDGLPSSPVVDALVVKLTLPEVTVAVRIRIGSKTTATVVGVPLMTVCTIVVRVTLPVLIVVVCIPTVGVGRTTTTISVEFP